MTHKEKATEIVEMFFKDVFNGANKIQDDFQWNKAKQCATKFADGKIEVLDRISSGTVLKSEITGNWTDVETEIENWQQVKNEIEKL